MRYLIILAVFCLVSCNTRLSTNISRYNEYAETNETEAAESIDWLESNFLTVVIPTEYRKRDLLIKGGYEDEALEIKNTNERYLKIELEAFKLYYDFSKLYYITDEDWQNYQKGKASLTSLEGEKMDIMFSPEQIQLHFNRADYVFDIKKNGKPVPKYFPSRNGSASRVKRAQLFDSEIEDYKITDDLFIAIRRWQKGLKEFRDKVKNPQE